MQTALAMRSTCLKKRWPTCAARFRRCAPIPPPAARCRSLEVLGNLEGRLRQVDFELPAGAPALTTHRIHAVPAAQEGLTNVRKHAHASQVVR